MYPKYQNCLYPAGGLTIDPTVGFRKRGYVGQFYAK